MRIHIYVASIEAAIVMMDWEIGRRILRCVMIVTLVAVDD